LLFVDDRYDSSFIYLLILFLYSIDQSWNLTIITTEDNKKNYEKDLNKLNVEAKIILLKKKFNSIDDYSQLLKNIDFWILINEENCLLFQYDSFSMGKFKDIFFQYNYIGARWCNNNSLYKEVIIGNGGTSFRKNSVMKYICNKYKNKDIKKDYPEDLYFSEFLYEEKMNYCTKEIADQFSFENLYNPENNSIYGHQIYKSISYNDLDKFMYEKINSLIL
jgi:hypothetical protein